MGSAIRKWAELTAILHQTDTFTHKGQHTDKMQSRPLPLNLDCVMSQRHEPIEFGCWKWSGYKGYMGGYSADYCL